jgi:C4-dicarboxylate-specific signal transduction histidine kinase
MVEKIQEIETKSRDLRILYVEDNEDLRERTISLLKLFFTHIEIAVDGKEGLQKFKDTKIDLVITDINMPELSGLDMLQAIKKIDSEVPCVLVSAYSNTEYFKRSIRLGVDGYLIKPVELEQYVEIMYKLVDKITIKKENEIYKAQLEQKVQEQIEHIRQKDKLLLQKSKMAGMGEMISMIAHQWKQPLNILSLNLANLEMMHMAKKYSKQELEYIIVNSKEMIEYMNKTIHDFATFLRPSNKMTVLNVGDIFNQLTSLTAVDIKKLKVDFTIRYETNKKNKIKLIPSEFTQVMINIVKNAMDEFRVKKIEKPFIHIAVEQTLEHYTVTIKDNAGGIPQSILDTVFEPYVSTKSKNGTGLGMYMSKLIIEGHFEGNIEVHNNEQGACFVITLPAEFDFKL